MPKLRPDPRPFPFSATLAALAVLGCSKEPAPNSGPALPSPPSPDAGAPDRGTSGPDAPLPAATVGFVDLGAELGLVHTVARGGDDYFMPDSMGPGSAVFDADGDGDLDVFLVQGVRGAAGALESDVGRDVLFLRDADGRYRNASAGSGLDDARYGMGAAVADVESDGDLDLFVTNYGSSRLFLNRGDATFEDATEKSGIVEQGWAATAGFCDYDADGRPDLFVARYLDYDPAVAGKGAQGARDYPSPLQFRGLADRLWHNEGGGRFRDVSAEAGIAGVVGRGLGLAFLDLDGDGRLDVFVANDSEPNFAWIQRENGRFENRAFALNLAVNRVGRPEANMGVAVGDVDGDGGFELFVTHLVAENNVLWGRAKGSSAGPFQDLTDRLGLAAPSLDLTGFGTQFGDLDLDGDLDLCVANGRILRRGARVGTSLPAHWQPYGEEQQVFLNEGPRFRLATPAEGGDFARRVAVGRGLVLADLDGDGGLDLLATNGEGTLAVFGNRWPRRGAHLVVRARDPSGRIDALDARIEVRIGERSLVRALSTCQGYLSAGPPVAHFGLGDSGTYDSIVVHWPGGASETFPGGAAGREVVLVRGTGR